MKRAKRAGKRRGVETRAGWWRTFRNHAAHDASVYVVTILGFAVGVLGLAYTMFGPFNLIRRAEPQATEQERAYAVIAREATEDAAALLDLALEPPHLRDKFERADYMNLSRRVEDGLRRLREAEPSERLRAVHSDVILFLEKTQEAAALMSRFSRTLDMGTLNRAGDASTEARRALDRTTAELNLLRKKMGK